MLIPRYYDNLDDYLTENKVLLILGPRQVGKTTLLKNFLQKTKLKCKLVSGENIIVQDVLSSQNFDRIKEFAEGYDLLAIDEAHKIKGVGLGLKIIVDNIPGIKVIATGSSSFELLGQTGEPLTGRKRTVMLFPVAQLELNKIYNKFELKENLGDYLVFGSYPEVLTQKSRKRKIEILHELTESYLLKDILEFERIKGSRYLFNLLRMLAYQVGSQVSFNELAQNLGVDVKTVARYIDLLKKSFILYEVQGYSRNLRKEITKKSKYYFYDNGVRNALIANFNDLDLRNDVGALWENFIFVERLKKREYKGIFANVYFWRTWDKQEIDLIEEREGKLFAYEIKWSKRKVKVPSQWKAAYRDGEFKVITRDNYLEFIL
ncbi:MAG: ATP-binding protein [Caldisericaceae bacterium]|nr:ATP-binding protein [Caldisericaceae bacterium]